MNWYRNFSIRTKVGGYLAFVLSLFVGLLGAAWWFLQQPGHHGLQLGLFFLGGFGVLLLAVTVLFVLIDRTLVRPLIQLESEIRSIARGNLDESITELDVEDEIGSLSTSLREMKAQLVSTVREAQQFEKALEHAGHAIYITDTDGTIEYANPAFESITKYEPDEAVGEDPNILQSGVQPDSYYEELWEAILDGETWEEEFVNQRATGERFHADQTIAPITNGDGDVTGFVAVMADRTDQRVLEQQTQVLSRVLRHNLRTECNIIDGYAHQLVQSDDPDEISDYGHEIHDRVQKLVEVGDMADRTMRELRGDDTPQSRGVCEALERVQTSLEERHPSAAITTEIPDSEVYVTANVEVIVEEAIENAIEHNTCGSPAVTVRVTLEAESGGTTVHPTVRIDVEDNGPGIPPLERSVIERGEETPLFHGSGLGLWLIYWEVTLAGGGISISERDSQGTCVSITLPRASVSTFPRNSIDEPSDATTTAVESTRGSTTPNHE